MADGISGGQQFSEEIKETANEVLEDTKDAVGAMVEQGVQSVIVSTPTPAQVQQKQQEDQTKIAEARRVIQFYKDTDDSQRRVREELKQKEMQRLQDQKQETQVIEMKKEEKKKQPVNPALAFAGKPERKGGVGG